MKIALPIQIVVFLVLLMAGRTEAHADAASPIQDDLLQVIRDISQRYDVHFTYDRELVEDVEIKEYNPGTYVNVDDALSKVLAGTNLKYVMLEMKYVIIYQDDAAGIKSLEQMVEILGKIIDQKTGKGMVTPLDRLKSSFHLNLIHLKKQRMLLNVSGTVVDQSGEPLIGVNVMVEDTNQGTATDIDGRFLLEDVNENAVLVFSYIGYQTQEFVLNGRSNINITMMEDLQTLDEVVVVGYGSVRKRDLTGAVSSIKAEDLVTSSSVDIGRVLKGRLSGLMIRENSAQPGGGLDILVRGAGSVNASNDRLIVVDGFPISELYQPRSGGKFDAGTHGILNSFNPNDIASIEVLKDVSSTAIYGARGANGVILITTKSGADGKPKVNYSMNFSSQKYKDSYELLNGKERLVARNEGKYDNWLISNNVNPYGQRSLSDALENPVGGVLYTPDYSEAEIQAAGKGVDWLDLVTRTGLIQQHNLSVSGGTSSTKYLLSGNLFSHDGIVKNSGLDRFSFRANVDQKINDLIKIGVNMTTSRINNDNTQLREKLTESGSTGIIRAAIQANPLIEPIDENGNYPRDPQRPLDPNPYSYLTITDKGEVDRMLLNSYLDLQPIESISIRFKAGMDRGVTKRRNYLPRTTLPGESENGVATIANSNIDSYLYEVVGNYNKKISSHSINVMLGASKQKFTQSSDDLRNSIFVTDGFLWNNIGSGGGFPIVSSTGSESAFISYFGRINYDFESKYLVTATLRADGASVFADNNKWGYFPAIAFGWNLIKEPWLENLNNNFSQLKLRLSIGQTGNASIAGSAFAAYQARNAWVTGDAQVLTGVFLTQLENPNLKWETTSEVNLGLDYSLVRDRISGSIELYYKEISDLINTHFLNSYHVVNQITDNIGITESRGVELSLNTVNIENRQFQWRSILNLSKFKDNWKQRAHDWKPSIYENENDPIRPQYSMRADGIVQIGEEVPAQPTLIPGEIKVKDVDGYLRDSDGNPKVDENGRFIRLGSPDGIIDDADNILLGSTDPGLIFGLTNILYYKNWTLNIDFNGMLNRKIDDPTLLAYGTNYNGALRTVLDRWTLDNQSTDHPRYASRYSGDFYLQNAGFIRLQNVEVVYKIPERIYLKAFSNLSVSLGASNLFWISPYTGVDPETDTYIGAYPNVKTYTVGLNLIF